MLLALLIADGRAIAAQADPGWSVPIAAPLPSESVRRLFRLGRFHEWQIDMMDRVLGQRERALEALLVEQRRALDDAVAAAEPAMSRLRRGEAIDASMLQSVVAVSTLADRQSAERLRIDDEAFGPFEQFVDERQREDFRCFRAAVERATLRSFGSLGIELSHARVDPALLLADLAAEVGGLAPEAIARVAASRSAFATDGTNALHRAFALHLERSERFATLSWQRMSLAAARIDGTATVDAIADLRRPIREHLNRLLELDLTHMRTLATELPEPIGRELLDRWWATAFGHLAELGVLDARFPAAAWERIATTCGFDDASRAALADTWLEADGALDRLIGRHAEWRRMIGERTSYPVTALAPHQEAMGEGLHRLHGLRERVREALAACADAEARRLGDRLRTPSEPPPGWPHPWS